MNQILSELSEIERAFLDDTIDKKQLTQRFNKYLNIRNMMTPAISQKIISLLDLGITDPHHEERLFQHGDIQFMVDVELYDLIGLLYKLGIFTKSSCQGDDQNTGYIIFADQKSIMRFTEVCKSRDLFGMDIIDGNNIFMGNPKMTGKSPAPSLSIRFDNKNIGAIYNSIEKTST